MSRAGGGISDAETSKMLTALLREVPNAELVQYRGDVPCVRVMTDSHSIEVCAETSTYDVWKCPIGGSEEDLALTATDLELHQAAELLRGAA